MKTVLVLGSTGSIGKSTLEVLDLHKENFKCIGLSANKNFQALHEQANKYSVKNICIQEGSTLETGIEKNSDIKIYSCLLYTSPSPRDNPASRMPSSA